MTTNTQRSTMKKISLVEPKLQKQTQPAAYPAKNLLILDEPSGRKFSAKKSAPAIPDDSKLTPEQLERFNEMKEFIAKPGDGSTYVLRGYAGTGKTFTISALIEHVLSGTNKKVAMTAPTHKAVKVLGDTSKFESNKLEYATVHGLLALRQVIDNYGNQSFVQLNRDHAKVGEFGVLVVDEASMLADELFYLLHDYSKSVKIIFVGDPAQIPPVGMSESIPFNTAQQEKLRIQEGLLTTVVRQAADNPIIALTMKIRSAIGRDNVIPVRQNKFDANSLDGVFFLDNDDKDFFMGLLKTYFTSANFEQDSDYAKVICWTNKAVNTFNAVIRKMIYGSGATKICVGEKLIANKPITDVDGNPLFNNNDEFEVDAFETVEATYKGWDLKFYDALVTQKSAGTMKSHNIRIIHEESDAEYLKFLQDLISRARGARKGSWEAGAIWKEFYAVQEIFADVNYNYAITGHKSQGSTYQNVIVIESDMDSNRDIVERNRIKYTAFTRPSRKLFICN